ncbi:Hypothetical predicted protein [Mytilus galloprovincialis]|uniref:EGF-like domain-containing protein n=1 Tax=Mytilus galloprovincialis TaxID=29158 RepID=A0A8B6GEC1_MYTGA|nr:Hypothetical predicted protein [Mytilus galloprovincialis]
MTYRSLLSIREFKHGATCKDKVSDNYSCSYPPGYNGKNCGIDINECKPNPCKYGASCMNEVNGYTCVCKPGYEGKNCEIDINECKPNPCKYGASCMNEVNGYTCVCKPGYEGKNCEIDINECKPNPCKHGALCMNKVNRYTCVCKPGYEGKNCEIDINECKPNPCKHGASCMNEVNGYTCVCIPGYEGKNCEIDINECKPNPCKHGASCMNEVNGYTCVCQPGYNGKNCEIDINECKPNPCKHGATCMNEVNGYTCVCKPGYEGKNCEIGKLQKNLKNWTKSKISKLPVIESGKDDVIDKTVVLLSDSKTNVSPPNQRKRTNNTSSSIRKQLKEHHQPKYYNSTIERLDNIRVYDWSLPVWSNSSCIPLKNLHKTTYICLFDPKDDVNFSRSLIETGVWDKQLLREFKLLLAQKQDLNLLDIGSHLGLYSLTAAMLGHNVVSVEPFNKLFPAFYKSVVMNKFQKRITLLANAISSKKEFVKLSYEDKDMTSATVQSANEEEITIENIASQKVIPSITWKDLAHFVPFNKIVLKYDISFRNHNNNLLTEASDLFSTLDVQYVFMHWNHFILDAGNIVAFFKSRSYIPKKRVFGKPLKLSKFLKWKGGIIWEKDSRA